MAEEMGEKRIGALLGIDLFQLLAAYAAVMDAYQHLPWLKGPIEGHFPQPEGLMVLFQDGGKKSKRIDRHGDHWFILYFTHKAIK
jgi:hypothetical protein